MRLVWLGTAVLAALLGGSDSLHAQGGRPAGPFGFPGWDSKSGGYDRSRWTEEKEKDKDKKKDKDAAADKDGAEKKGPPWMRGGMGFGKMPYADEKTKKEVAPEKKGPGKGEFGKKKDFEKKFDEKKKPAWAEGKKEGPGKKDEKKKPAWAEEKKKESPLAKKTPDKKTSPWAAGKGKDLKDWRHGPWAMHGKAFGKGHGYFGMQAFHHHKAPWAAHGKFHGKGHGMYATKFGHHHGASWAGHGKPHVKAKAFHAPAKHHRGGPAWGHHTGFHAKASHGKHCGAAHAQHGHFAHHKAAVHHRGGPAWGAFQHHRGGPAWATSHGRGGKHAGHHAPARHSWTGYGSHVGYGFGPGHGGHHYGPPSFHRGW